MSRFGPSTGFDGKREFPIPVALIADDPHPHVASTVAKIVEMAAGAETVSARVFMFYVEFLVPGAGPPPETRGGTWRTAPGGLVVTMDRDTLGRRLGNVLFREAGERRAVPPADVDAVLAELLPDRTS